MNDVCCLKRLYLKIALCDSGTSVFSVSFVDLYSLFVICAKLLIKTSLMIKRQEHFAPF
jgi:hypothetical protein